MFLSILFPALILETVGLWLMITATFSTSTALCLHVAAALLPAIGAWFAHRTGRSPYRLALIALFALAIPGIGLYGCTAAVLLADTVVRGKGLAHDLERQDYAPPLIGHEEIRSRTVFLKQELGVEPVVDILRGKDSALKRGAIGVLGKLRSPEAVSLLRRCLQDPDPEVRFYAHTSLTEMEEDFTRRLEDVGDASDGNGRGREQRARILTEYARTGLPEESMRIEALSQARTLLEQALQDTTGTDPLHLDLAHICLELKDRDGAEKHLDAYSGQESVRRRTLMSRLLFEKRDFPALAILNRLPCPHPDSSRPSAALWCTETLREAEHA